MGGNYLVNGVRAFGRKAGTVSATAFYQNIDPVRGSRTAITYIMATCSATGGDKLTVMKDISTVAATVSAAVGAVATVVLSADPVPAGAAIAANDYVCLEQTDGTYHFSKVTSWTGGSKTLVLTTTLTVGVAAGTRVWCFGIKTDLGHCAFNLPTASTQYTFSNGGDPIALGKEKHSPLMIAHDNADADGSGFGSIDQITIKDIDI